MILTKSNLKIQNSKSQKPASAKFKTPETQIEELRILEKLGFKVNENYKLCKNLDEIQKLFESWEDKRNKQEYGIDGIGDKNK